ncbi:hypothetical protein F5877DRAFT_65612 [Lentinula edodes]|nr:hypothetical protein F5877DRAFT_65612 [Lentinula edodes]
MPFCAHDNFDNLEYDQSHSSGSASEQELYSMPWSSWPRAGDMVLLWAGISAGILKTSYLARIMDREIYVLDGKSSVGGGGVTIVKLVSNFRSHPAILEFSNEHFHSHELPYCGNSILLEVLHGSVKHLNF